MEMTGQQLIAAPIDRTWVALNDPGMLRQCIPGCESIDRVSENSYALGMAVRVGPMNARFKGKLDLENVQPPRSYTIRFEGQGGAAGFGKGSADVTLTPQEAGTQLDYAVKAQVGGKIAQIGSRLVDAAARKMADDFFTAFNARVSAGAAPAAAPALPEEETVAAGVAAEAGLRAPAGTPPARAGVPMWVWIVGAIIVVAVIAWLAR